MSMSEKVKELKNHPCVNWSGTDEDAEALITDLIHSYGGGDQTKGKKGSFRKFQGTWTKNTISAERLDHLWKASHIRALADKLPDVTYTKLSETKTKLVEELAANREVVLKAMQEVVTELKAAALAPKPHFDPFEKAKQDAKTHKPKTTLVECPSDSDGANAEDSQKYGRYVKTKNPRVGQLIVQETSLIATGPPKQSVGDLKLQAKELGIKGFSSMNKATLMEKIALVKSGAPAEPEMDMLEIVEVGKVKKPKVESETTLEPVAAPPVEVEADEVVDETTAVPVAAPPVRVETDEVVEETTAVPVAAPSVRADDHTVSVAAQLGLDATYINALKGAAGAIKQAMRARSKKKVQTGGSMNVPDLKKRAKDLKVKGFSKMKKAELEEAIRKAEAETVLRVLAPVAAPVAAAVAAPVAASAEDQAEDLEDITNDGYTGTDVSEISDDLFAADTEFDGEGLRASEYVDEVHANGEDEDNGGGNDNDGNGDENELLAEEYED